MFIAEMREERVRFKKGQLVWFINLVGGKRFTNVVCVVDGGRSVFCEDGNYLPMRLFGVKWGLA